MEKQKISVESLKVVAQITNNVLEAVTALKAKSNVSVEVEDIKIEGGSVSVVLIVGFGNMELPKVKVEVRVSTVKDSE